MKHKKSEAGRRAALKGWKTRRAGERSWKRALANKIGPIVESDKRYALLSV